MPIASIVPYEQWPEKENIFNLAEFLKKALHRCASSLVIADLLHMVSPINGCNTGLQNRVYTNIMTEFC